MSKILIKNIKKLVQVREEAVAKVCGKEMDILPCLENAWLAIDNGLIADFGSMNDFPGIADWHGLEVIDAGDKMVFPTWVDSHTHLVYAGSREQEFADRIKGLSYEEIAKRGGGILNSANKLHNASEEELIQQALPRLKEIISQGTGAVEIKSGYGLSLEAELKMLRVIKKLKELSPLTIKATFLGAHAIPLLYKENRRGYIDLLIKEMIPAVAEEKLAEFIDIFCEQNYFSFDETVEILETGKKYNLIPKVHAEQLSHHGGTKAGVQCGAISVDHLEFVNEDDIKLLKDSKTMPTILPGAAFFLSLPNPPARKMIDEGLPLAIATDFNPGSCPSGNMNLMQSIACVQYKLTPNETINASTINTAYVMQAGQELGSITIGKKANLFITKQIPSIEFMPYSFGSNLIDTVILNEKFVINQMAEKKFRWFKIFSSEEEMKNNVAFRKTLSIQVDGKKICIVHGLDGFYAVRDKCPHNGFPLSAGYCTDVNSIVCPVHRYHFDLKTGKALSGMGTKVETFPIEITEKGVLLGVEEFNWWPF